MKSTLAAVISALPEPIRRGSDLARVLGLGAAQAWSIFKVISASDPLSAGPYLPGSAMMRRLCKAAEGQGVSPALTAKAQEAFADFERLVRRHAIDRTTFNSLIRDLDGTDPGKDDLVHKRAMYRAARHLYGVHAEVILESFLLKPSPGGESIEELDISGYSQLQQGRSWTTLLSEHAAVVQMHEGDPLHMAPNAGNDIVPGMRMLEEYCSKPLPDMRTAQGSTGRPYTQVHSREMGNKGASTYFLLNHLLFPVPLAEIRGETHTYYSIIPVPSKVCLRDIWIHESICSDQLPTMQVYICRTGFMSTPPVRPEDRLPVHERFDDLGRGTSSIHVPELPRYTEMVQHVADAHGWNLNEFRTFRCRIEYPMPASHLRIELKTS